MKPLKLFTFTLAPYRVIFVNGHPKENAANAYIYYAGDDNSQMYDHEGNIIGAFMNTDKRNALEQHLREVVMPKLAAELRYSPFWVSGMDYVNQAPHPLFVVQRKDNKPLDNDDLMQMEKKLQTAINKINHPQTSVKLFHAANDHQDAQPHHEHNLRSRRK